MAKAKIDKKIYRIIDANINRATEGLRVCEDIVRFILNDKDLITRYKNARHKIIHTIDPLVGKIDLLKVRNILKDVGKHSVRIELKRKNYQEIYFANIQRVKESIRVLEEFLKLINRKIAVNFKDLRYKIYQLEKKTIEKL